MTQIMFRAVLFKKGVDTGFIKRLYTPDLIDLSETVGAVPHKEWLNTLHRYDVLYDPAWTCWAHMFRVGCIDYRYIFFYV